MRIPRFCVDGSNSVPNLPLPMKNIGKKAPGSFIHKLYGLRSPDPLHKRVGEPDYIMTNLSTSTDQLHQDLDLHYHSNIYTSPQVGKSDLKSAQSNLAARHFMWAAYTARMVRIAPDAIKSIFNCEAFRVFYV